MCAVLVLKNKACKHLKINDMITLRNVSDTCYVTWLKTSFERFHVRGDFIMMSISEYATARKVSGVAVRKQLQRYQKELEGHIMQDGRRRMLDDYAIDFLDGHRMKREVIVEMSDQATKKEIERLKNDLELYREKVTTLQDMIISLQQEQMELIRYKAENQLLLEQKQRDQEQLQEVRQELQETQTKLQEKDQEVNSYVKSWFGFYRKK